VEVKPEVAPKAELAGLVLVPVPVAADSSRGSLAVSVGALCRRENTLMRNHVIELLYARTKETTRIATVVGTVVFGQKSASCPCFLPVYLMRSNLHMMLKIWLTGRSKSLISLAFMLKMAAMKDNGN
jgi:hypothetical protein